MTQFTKKHEISGRRFGRLVAQHHVGHGFWVCLCDCGATKKYKAGDLVANECLSCGCIRREMVQQSRVKMDLLKQVVVSESDLKRHLFYNRETGEFIWLVSPRFSVPAGSVVRGGDPARKYILIGLNGRRYPAHRLAWFYVHGVWPSGVIDHINGNCKDNRIANLRDCSASINAQNQRQPHCGNTSGYLGVSRSHSKTNPYRAQINIAGKITYIGIYQTAELAHKAYVEKKRSVHEGCTI